MDKLIEETQPGHKPPSHAAKMRELTEKHQRDDAKSEYNRVLKQIEEAAKAGMPQKQFDIHWSEYTKGLLKADGYKLTEGRKTGASHCSCDWGCSNCSSYDWTIVNWEKAV